MLLQRLLADDRADGCGLNYDYMGSAEFEFGATREARIKLANLQIEGKLVGKQVRLYEKWGRSNRGPIDVYLFGSQEYIDKLLSNPPVLSLGVNGDLIVCPTKEAARIDDIRYIGWMQVRSNEPLLIIRATRENLDRGNKFLQLFMDGILAEEKEKSIEQKSEAYLNGWADASSLSPRLNLHPKESDEARDYDHGYTMSMQENV